MGRSLHLPVVVCAFWKLRSIGIPLEVLPEPVGYGHHLVSVAIWYFFSNGLASLTLSRTHSSLEQSASR